MAQPAMCLLWNWHSNCADCHAHFDFSNAMRELPPPTCTKNSAKNSAQFSNTCVCFEHQERFFQCTNICAESCAFSAPRSPQRILHMNHSDAFLFVHRCHLLSNRVDRTCMCEIVAFCVLFHLVGPCMINLGISLPLLAREVNANGVTPGLFETTTLISCSLGGILIFGVPLLHALIAHKCQQQGFVKDAFPNETSMPRLRGALVIRMHMIPANLLFLLHSFLHLRSLHLDERRCLLEKKQK